MSAHLGREGNARGFSEANLGNLLILREDIFQTTSHEKIEEDTDIRILLEDIENTNL